MIAIELVTGEPIVVAGDDVRLVAEQVFGGRGPAGAPPHGIAFFTTTAGVEVCVNPAHVVRISTGHRA
jgi:hypothetical protein